MFTFARVGEGHIPNSTVAGRPAGVRVLGIEYLSGVSSTSLMRTAELGSGDHKNSMVTIMTENIICIAYA